MVLKCVGALGRSSPGVKLSRFFWANPRSRESLAWKSRNQLSWNVVFSARPNDARVGVQVAGEGVEGGEVGEVLVDERSQHRGRVVGALGCEVVSEVVVGEQAGDGDEVRLGLLAAVDGGVSLASRVLRLEYLGRRVM